MNARLTTAQAAKRMRIGVRAVLALVTAGVLKPTKFGKSYAYDPVDVDRAARRPRAGVGGRPRNDAPPWRE
jgi:excisionase family DNA binding protein